MMKIGIITDSVDTSNAGISVYTKNLVENILKLDKDNIYTLIHRKKNDKHIYKQTEEIIVPLKKIPFAPVYRKLFQLPKILEAEKFDIVHETAQIGPFLFNTKFKKVVTVHDLVALKFPQWSSSWSGYVNHKLGLKRALKNVDKIIASSENTKKDIIEYFDIDESKIKVIYLGYNEHKIKFSERDVEKCLTKYQIKKPYLLYIGTLEPRKNIPNLIRAFKESKSSAQLVIGGSKGWKHKEIFEVVKKLKLENKVKFIGFVEDKDLPILYQNAHVFVFPSLYEGFGLPVLEAMGSGCPVITSNLSSLPEVAGDAAILVNPYDVYEISQAIREIEKESTRKELIKKGLEQAKKFSWEITTKETIEVYKELKNTG